MVALARDDLALEVLRVELPERAAARREEALQLRERHVATRPEGLIGKPPSCSMNGRTSALHQSCSLSLRTCDATTSPKPNSGGRSTRLHTSLQSDGRLLTRISTEARALLSLPESAGCWLGSSRDIVKAVRISRSCPWYWPTWRAEGGEAVERGGELAQVGALARRAGAGGRRPSCRGFCSVRRAGSSSLVFLATLASSRLSGPSGRASSVTTASIRSARWAIRP